MNAQDFAYWLTGFVELTQGQTPNPAQWKSIREHLDLVFKKVTPEVAVEQKVTAPAGTDVGEIMRKYQESLKRPFDWTQQPITITC